MNLTSCLVLNDIFDDIGTFYSQTGGFLYNSNIAGGLYVSTANAIGSPVTGYGSIYVNAHPLNGDNDFSSIPLDGSGNVLGTNSDDSSSIVSMTLDNARLFLINDESTGDVVDELAICQYDNTLVMVAGDETIAVSALNSEMTFDGTNFSASNPVISIDEFVAPFI